MRPGDGRVKWKTAGDSGGVTGSDAAVGDGSASILERKRARRSTVGNVSTRVKGEEIGEGDGTIEGNAISHTGPCGPGGSHQ